MDLKDLFIKQIIVGPMKNFAYIVGDRVTKEAALIDPGWESDRLVKEIEAAGLRLTHILLTHTHFDHIGEVDPLTSRFPLKVFVHCDESSVLAGIPGLVEISDGDSIPLGNLKIDVLHTPGHCKGAVCFKVDSVLFTGDTLFINAIGRTDLPGGDPEEMYHSLEKIKKLPENLVVFSGHDYGPTPTATLGEQKKTNSYLQKRSEADFLKMVG